MRYGVYKWAYAIRPHNTYNTHNTHNVNNQ